MHSFYKPSVELPLFRLIQLKNIANILLYGFDSGQNNISFAFK